MINAKKIGIYAAILIFGVALFIFASFLITFGFGYKAVIGSILYFITTFLLLKNISSIKPILLVQLVTLPILFILIFFNILDFQSTWISAPSNIFLLLSSYTAYIFYISRSYLLPVLFCVLLFGWQYKGSKMFLNYMQYGTVSGKVYKPMPLIVVYDSTRNMVKFPTNSKTIILDFWNSHCAPCFAQFPFIDSIYKNIDTSKYELFVVNVPLNGERKENNFKLLDKYNYSFRKVFANDESIMDAFSIRYFPTSLIIKENIVVFIGDFSEAVKSQYFKKN